MKRKLSVLLLMMIIILTTTACGKDSNEVSSENDENNVKDVTILLSGIGGEVSTIKSLGELPEPEASGQLMFYDTKGIEGYFSGFNLGLELSTDGNTVTRVFLQPYDGNQIKVNGFIIGCDITETNKLFGKGELTSEEQDGKIFTYMNYKDENYNIQCTVDNNKVTAVSFTKLGSSNNQNEAGAAPELTYPLYDVSKVMYDTTFKNIDSDPRYYEYTFEANKEHAVTTYSGIKHKVLYTYNDKEVSVTINGNKTVISEFIPIELLYDKINIRTDGYEDIEFLEVHYLFRVAPDGIANGIVTEESEVRVGVLGNPYNENINYDVDDYLNLLGQKEEIITKELGSYEDYSNNYYNEELHGYVYDRLIFYAYKDEICAITVAGQKIFGRTWKTFSNDQVHYSQIENFMGADFDITSIKTKYYENALDETLDFIKFKHGDYILYFRLWGDNEDEIGRVVVIHKDFEGKIDDALLAML